MDILQSYDKISRRDDSSVPLVAVADQSLVSMEKTRSTGLAAAVTLAAILALAARVGLDGRRDQGTPPRRPAAIIGGEDAPSTATTTRVYNYPT